MHKEAAVVTSSKCTKCTKHRRCWCGAYDWWLPAGRLPVGAVPLRNGRQLLLRWAMAAAVQLSQSCWEAVAAVQLLPSCRARAAAPHPPLAAVQLPLAAVQLPLAAL